MLQMSVLSLYFWLEKSCSGLAYHSVVAYLVMRTSGLPKFLAELKSINFTVPSWVTIIFCGFTSLCITLFSCKYFTPSSTYFIMHFTWAGPIIVLSLSSIKSIKVTGAHSKTKYSKPFLWKMSKSYTTFGCFKVYRSRISRKRDITMPSRPITFFCFLIAT
jgi:hypothetical protein